MGSSTPKIIEINHSRRGQLSILGKIPHQPKVVPAISSHISCPEFLNHTLRVIIVHHVICNDGFLSCRCVGHGGIW